jgi:hypothetical protein
MKCHLATLLCSSNDLAVDNAPIKAQAAAATTKTPMMLSNFWLSRNQLLAEWLKRDEVRLERPALDGKIPGSEVQQEFAPGG